MCVYVACVVALSLRGGRVHVSLFVLALIQTRPVAASLISIPRSISAMPVQEGEICANLLVRMQKMGQVEG